MRSLTKKTVLLFTCSSLFFTACQKDSPIEEVDPPVVPEKIEFIDLKYLLSDKEEKQYELVGHTTTFNNQTSVEQLLPLSGFSSFENYMYFLSDDDIVSGFVRDSILVNIPESLDNEAIYLTKEKYLFSKSNIALPTISMPTDTLTVVPYSTTTVQMSLVLKEYTLGFELTYKSNLLDKEEKAYGKWKMVQLVDVKTKEISTKKE